MKTSTKKIVNRKNLFIIFIIYFLVIIFSTFIFFRKIKSRHDFLVDLNKYILESLKGIIDNSLEQSDSLISNISYIKSEDFTGDTETLSAVITDMLPMYPDIIGAGVAFNPEFLKKEDHNLRTNHSDLLALYVVRDTLGKLHTREIRYDYTDTSLATACWYTEPVSLKKECWVGPYFGEALQMQCIDYCKPEYDQNGNLLYVVFASYSLSLFQSCISDSIRFLDGYSCLVSGDGTFLYHPRTELMDLNQTLKNVGLKTHNSTLLACSDSITNHSLAGKLKYKNIYTKEITKLTYQRIKGIGWYLLSVFPDIFSQPLCLYSRQIFFFVFVMINFLCIGACLVFWRSHWLISISVSLIFTIGILVTCILAVKKYESGPCNSLNELVIQNRMKPEQSKRCGWTILENTYAVQAYTNKCFNYNTTRSFPVGIVVQTIDFEGANKFKMSGYIWEKYENRNDTALLGIEFPENESVTFTQVYDDSLEHNRFVRGWHFSTVIRQPFEYQKYPLDKDEIWLRMSPAGMSQGVRLVPDYEGYKFNQSLPIGIDQNLVLPQWKILSTNFSIDVNNTPSTYGRESDDSFGQNLELYFSLHVRRNIIDAFISQFIPLLVIMLMLFSILWVGRKRDSNGLLGFNSLAGTSGCSALFFVVIYNHISIRNQLGTPGVVYMEYFFFITYLAILLVSLNSILVALDQKSTFINHKDNHLSRLLYWPLITGCLFLITFREFFE